MHSKRRWVAISAFLLLTALAVLARYFLFAEGILYGQAAAKMASLTVAGVIIAAGFVPLWMLRSSDGPDAEAAGKETITATVAAILGIATAAYGVSELLAPNTPVQAAAPACAGAPVYGAQFFATTPSRGANARRGPGREYQQVSRYSGNCTLGFDGYCIGPPEPDLVLGTPDQRWLIVHRRLQFVAAGVVQSQTAESALGAHPKGECAKLGGVPQPNLVEQLNYNIRSGTLTAIAPGAVAVGYGLATVSQHNRSYKALALGVLPDFSAHLASSSVGNDMQLTNGDVWLVAAICLADNVPIPTSLRAEQLTVRHSRVSAEGAAINVPRKAYPQLAEIACNSSG